MKNPPEIENIIQEIIKFRDKRDWEQFHNLKDLAIGLNIESSELLELFLWKSSDEIDELINNNEYNIRIKEELADILIFSFLISHKLGVNIEDIILSKLEKNSIKYPIDKSKGKALKYSKI